MKIKNVEIINFKGLENFIQTFSLDNNKISGHNGAGKSAIKEAIIFGLYGRTPDGSAQNTDTFIRRGTNSTKVAIELDSGEKIIRMKSAKSNMVFLDDGSQAEEDSRVAQRDIEEIVIPGYMEFLSVFNTGFFMQNNDDKVQRAFIMTLTPAIDRLELFRKAAGDEELCSKYEIDPSDFNEAFKTIKGIRYDIKKTIDDLSANKDYVSEQLDSNKFETKETFKNKLDELIGIKERLDFLSKEWLKYHSISGEKNKVSMHNAKIKSQIEEIEKALNGLVIPDQFDQNKLSALVYQRNNLSTVNLPKGECPTCRQKITLDHKQKIEEYNIKIEKQIGEIDKEINKEREKINTRNEEINRLSREKRDKEAKLKALKESFMDDQIINRPLEAEPTQEEIDGTNKAIEEIKNILSLFSQKEDIVSKLANNKEELKKVELLCNLFGPTGLPSIEAKEKIEPIEKELTKYIKDVKIVILRLLKNGMEYKDTFDIEVSGKRYSRLSSGEKKKVDFALSIVFSKFLKDRQKNYSPDVASFPVPMSIFVDDADLLDEKGLNNILNNVTEEQIFTTHVTNDNLLIKTNGK